jgi:uncharacterized protein YqhQ
MTLLAPGMWLQRLTTREPSLDQLEVSIRALREVPSRGAPRRTQRIEVWLTGHRYDFVPT